MTGRLAICTNMPAPYRHALFNRIQGSAVDLTVYFYRRRGKGRTWTVDMQQARYAYRILSESQHWTPAHLFPLIAMVWRHRSSTVIVGGWGDAESFWAIFWCMFMRVRWGLWLGLNAPPRGGGMRGLLKRCLLRHAHVVVCYHRRTAEILRPLLPAETPVHAGWNVGDVEAAACIAATWDGVIQPPKVPRLVFVGVLNERKGVDLLIRAVEEGRLCCGLDLVGRGPLFDRAERAAASAPPGALRLHGFLEGAELHRVLAGADGFILPTRRDPGAIVTSEALAAGLYVLISDADGGVPDLRARCDPFVWVFAADNYEAMLGTIEEFLRAMPGKTKREVRGEFLGLDPIGVYAGAFLAAARR